MYMRAVTACTKHRFRQISGYQDDHSVTARYVHTLPGFLQEFLRKEGRMRYKDPTKQRDYLRNWRREQKLRKATQLPLYQTDRRYLENISARSTSIPNLSPVSLYQT